MTLFEITLACFASLLSNKSFSYGEKLELMPVESIIEISDDREQQHDLNEHDDEFEGVKSLKLCQKGFELIQNTGQGKSTRNVEDLKVEKKRLYAIVRSYTAETEGIVKLVPCYKCLSDPPIYIRINSAEIKNYDPFFSIIFKVDRAQPSAEQITNYVIKKVDKINEATVTSITTTPKNKFIISSYDPDVLTEKVRLEICQRAFEKISDAEGERINIQFLEATPASPSKYYVVVSKSYHDTKENVIKLYDCPTEPKIHIHVDQQKPELVIQAIIRSCEFKRRTIDFPPNLIITTFDSPNFSYDRVMEDLTAVVPCSSTNYLDTINGNSRSKRKQKVTQKVRKGICHSITSASLFTAQGFQLIDTDMSLEKDTLSDKSVSKKQDKVSQNEFFSDISVEHFATNPTASRKILVDSDTDPIVEEFFICHCRQSINGDEGQLKKFFVTGEYNMNYMQDSWINYISGRFIFVSDYHNMVNLYAVAEEPAEAVLEPDSDYKNVELLYLQRSSRHQPAEEESEDPLCQLSNEQKLRVCGLVFNSGYYNTQIEFPPIDTVIGRGECYRNTVSFRNEDVRAMTNGDEYQEWMTACQLSGQPNGNHGDNSLTFFLSRAYNDTDPKKLSAHDIFVYQRKSDGYYVQQSFTNIRLKYHET